MHSLEMVVTAVEIFNNIGYILVEPLGAKIDVTALYLGFEGAPAGDEVLTARVDACGVAFHAVVIVQLLAVHRVSRVTAGGEQQGDGCEYRFHKSSRLA
jgi:hypothetical protein